MYCVHCGTEVRPLDKFCPGCGEKRIKATPVPSVSTESPALSQPGVDPAIREPPPSRSNAALIGSVALVLVLILGVVGYRMSQPQPAFVSEGATPATSDVATTTTSEVAPTTDSATPSQPATPLNQAALGAAPDCSFLAPTFYCEGFGVEVGSATGYLDAGEISVHTVDLQIGDHILTGRCDSDCSDINLAVHGPGGDVVQDVDPDDDAPTIFLSVTAPGQFGLTVSMHACSVEPCEFTVAILKKATTTTDDVAMTTEALILATAQLATVPTSADYTARSWTDFEKLFPPSNWKDQEDPDYAFGRRADYAFARRDSYPFEGGVRSVEFMERVNVEAKGTRSMILEATLSHYTPVSGAALQLAFESVFSPTVLRCELDGSASGGELWYRVSPERMKPVTVKYGWSAGSGGVWESLTFDRSELPLVGTEHVGTIWTDQCSTPPQSRLAI